MNKCEITRDLIPGYADGILSPSGREYVETHTAECEECREALAIAKAAVVTGNAEENITAKKAFKKVNFKKVIILSVSLILAVVIVSFGAFAINDACSGYYKLNHLFGKAPWDSIVTEGMRLNADKIRELMGCEYGSLTLEAMTGYQQDGIKSKMTVVLRSEKDEYCYIYVKGYPTGIGTYQIDEFNVVKEDENGSMAIINSDGELFCAYNGRENIGGENSSMEGGFYTYRELIIEDGDKEAFISSCIKEYSKNWPAEQAEEMAKTAWERQVEFITNQHDETLRSLREEFKVSEDVIEKWKSFAN